MCRIGDDGKKYFLALKKKWSENSSFPRPIVVVRRSTFSAGIFCFSPVVEDFYLGFHPPPPWGSRWLIVDTMANPWGHCHLQQNLRKVGQIQQQPSVTSVVLSRPLLQTCPYARAPKILHYFFLYPPSPIPRILTVSFFLPRLHILVVVLEGPIYSVRPDQRTTVIVISAIASDRSRRRLIPKRGGFESGTTRRPK